jgi:hypothetical protein
MKKAAVIAGVTLAAVALGFGIRRFRKSNGK